MGATALIVGSVIFVVLGIASCMGIGSYVSYVSKTKLQKLENRGISFTAITIATISCWLMWIITYLHQMNPLIGPVAQAPEA